MVKKHPQRDHNEEKIEFYNFTEQLKLMTNQRIKYKSLLGIEQVKHLQTWISFTVKLLKTE